MPYAQSNWTCKYCDKVFDMEGHARICEESHLPVKELVVTNSETIPESMHKCYVPGEEFPQFLKIGNKQGKSATYALVRSGERAGGGSRPLRRGPIRLRPGN